MKWSYLRKTGLVMICLVSTGCSIKHYVASDYQKYLSNNAGINNLPTTNTETCYTLTKATESHRYEFRSAMAGYANLWIVELGKILDATMESKDIQQVFKKITKNNDGCKGSNITFDLKKYEFYDFGADITLHISIYTENNLVFEKTYQSVGKGQGGKMFFGGVFAMKNAIQQSTKSAVDAIMRDFINDINKKDVKDKLVKK